MAENLESLVGRFFETVGLVETAGYHTSAVLLDEQTQPFFGGARIFAAGLFPGSHPRAP